MKFTCEKQLLVKALNTANKAVTTRSTIPILKGILLEAFDDQTIKISTSNLDISIEKKMGANVEEEGGIVIASKLFSEIIRKLPGEEVSISLEENNQVYIKSMNSEFMIVGMPKEEFPNMKEIKEEVDLVIEKDLFKEMIKRTAFSASVDESKGTIVGVLTEIQSDHINMVALDGFRMAVSKENINNDITCSIIIDARIFSELQRIFTEEADEHVNVTLEEKKVIFSMVDTKIVIRLIEGDFIKYKDILPKEYKTRIKVNKNDFEDCLDRASLLAREGKNNLVKLTIEENNMIIKSRSEEGNLKEEAFIELEGDPLEIGFNAKYLIDVLKVVNDEDIYIEFGTNVSPCLIKPVDGNAFEYLVLPVRILT